jgi:flagellar biosynthesis protein FliQ
MRKQQIWKVANRYSSKLMLLCGGILIITGLLSIFISFLSQAGIIAGTTLTFIFTLLPIPLTERHLEKLFDKAGNRKTE